MRQISGIGFFCFFISASFAFGGTLSDQAHDVCASYKKACGFVFCNSHEIANAALIKTLKESLDKRKTEIETKYNEASKTLQGKIGEKELLDAKVAILKRNNELATLMQEYDSGSAIDQLANASEELGKEIKDLNDNIGPWGASRIQEMQEASEALHAEMTVFQQLSEYKGLIQVQLGKDNGTRAPAAFLKQSLVIANLLASPKVQIEFRYFNDNTVLRRSLAVIINAERKEFRIVDPRVIAQDPVLLGAVKQDLGHALVLDVAKVPGDTVAEKVYLLLDRYLELGFEPQASL